MMNNLGGSLICLGLFISGCVVLSAPVGNSDFDYIETLDQLEGKYQNLGEGGTESIEFYLSRLIWPREADFDHEIIDTIEVLNVHKNTLIVRAVSEGIILKQNKFIEGEDFVMVDGRIRLKQDATFLGMRGEPIVGPYYESLELGVDQRGQGKLRQLSAGAALIYLAIPVGGVGKTDVRFPRIK
jgi:hypothetical protein